MAVVIHLNFTVVVELSLVNFDHPKTLM